MKEYRRVNIDRLEARRSELYMQNRNAILAAFKVYRENNPEIVRERKADYHRRNKDRIVAKVKQWRIENPERNAELAREQMKKQRAKKPWMSSQYASERKATKINATPTWANRSKMVEFYKSASALNMLLGVWHHVDHIVPLRSPLVCGMHNEFNLQILTADENVRKGNRHWPDMPGTL